MRTAGLYNFKLSALVMLIYSIDSMAKALIADLKELFLEWQSQVSNNAAKEEEVYLTRVHCLVHLSILNTHRWQQEKKEILLLTRQVRL